MRDVFKGNKQSLCYDYNILYFNQLLYKNGITYGLTFIDIILRLLSNLVVKSIGYRTLSEETREIVTVTFLTQFLNIIVLYILSNSYFEYIPGLN